MTDDLALDARLRVLDAAPADQPVDRAGRDRLLEAILASDPAAEGPSRTPAVPPTSRRPARRIAWVAAAAVTVTAASLALPVTSGQPAFASWTGQPAQASAADGRALRAACLDQVGDSVGGDGAPLVPSDELSTRLVDRRGDWVSVLLTWTGPDRYQFTVACLGRLPAGSSEDPQDVTHGVSGGGGFAAPTGSDLLEGAMAELTVGGGLLGLGRTERAATTNGEVGPEVAGVTIHAGTTSVEASVEDGTYAAWWPGRVTDPAAEDGPSGSGDPEPVLRYDVTLRDGTVLRDVEPARPTTR